ncbi:MAG: AraC family transcriptional regulator [Bacteroidales bacterium]|nr:AraC family transcriptional regulator [Bacteroidales bacterium]
MADNPLLSISLADIRRQYPHLQAYSLDDDLWILEMNGAQIKSDNSVMNALREPIRFDGYLCMYCLSGHFQLEVNLKQYKIGPDSVFINTPGNIAKITEVPTDSLADYKFIFILASREFMQTIRFDFNKSFQDSIRIMQTPVITLNGQQREIAEDFLNLSSKIIRSSLTRRKEIIGSLITSLTYMASDVWNERLSSARPSAASASQERLSLLFDRFIALVAEYNTSQRGVAFYAEKLCLTPKYMSKLIKQASGKSAPEWIDSFVILEAKNMLKYSTGSIKEIVYNLHFPNQSVFYKFFKTHTGMTPSEFRKQSASA